MKDMIRLRILIREYHAGFPGWAQSNHKGSLQKGGRKIGVREGDVMRDAEVEFITLQEGGHEPRNVDIL